VRPGIELRAGRRSARGRGLLRAGLLFLLALPPAGCSDEGDEDLPYAPLGCERTEPDLGHLNIRLTLNRENPRVPITVYRGDVDAGEIVESDTVSVDRFSYELATRERYSVTALYIAGADTILVIDEARIGIDSKDYRDGTCYTSDDGEIDVRLEE
jgi:hypothetical protein